MLRIFFAGNATPADFADMRRKTVPGLPVYISRTEIIFYRKLKDISTIRINKQNNAPRKI
jgi:hypothetical protein